MARDENRLVGNMLTASGDNGILVSESARNVLISNTAWHMSDSGISFDAVTGSVAHGNDVRFNTGGFQLDGSSGNVLEANDASETGGIGIELGSGSYANVVRLNRADGNAAVGIYVADEALAPDPGNVLDGNTASHNGSHGIAVAKGGHTIVANIARSNGGWGINAIGENVDGGGNVATGNVLGQCLGVVCDAEGATHSEPTVAAPPSACPESVTVLADMDSWATRVGSWVRRYLAQSALDRGLCRHDDVRRRLSAQAGGNRLHQGISFEPLVRR